ncbi:MFS transporter [Cohnella ginsengisoli]|uniref:MFS transporter n=1 Tax=Cohnella ginsengisoli TaxID=425004 RepID=A0A9X4KKY2_9BACL|nr:MFS transporter [Cohnella ginsengisoli]MDG0793973.1 MFS transporter [Cohnella ginsengisoli]
MNSGRFKGLALLVLAVSQLMMALDYTIIFVAMPSLGQELGFSANHLQWVVSAYSLAFGGFLLIGGRLSDLMGRRRMFIIAMSLFGLGSLLGGLAESQTMLIIARGLQGLGGALLSPATLSLIMSNFEEGAERNRAMGIWAAMGGVGMSLGLLLGGVLTSFIGWEATFFVNVPIALLSLLFAPIVLKESAVLRGRKHFDIAGTISVTAGMLFVVYYLIQSPVSGWLNASTLPFVLLGAALLAAFIVIEKRSRGPLINFRMFRNRNLTGAALVAFLFSASFGTLFYFLTLYTQNVLHFSAIQSGFTFLPLTLSAFLGARLITPMLAKAGVAGTIASGMTLGGSRLPALDPVVRFGQRMGSDSRDDNHRSRASARLYDHVHCRQYRRRSERAGGILRSRQHRSANRRSHRVGGHHGDHLGYARFRLDHGDNDPRPAKFGYSYRVYCIRDRYADRHPRCIRSAEAGTRRFARRREGHGDALIEEKRDACDNTIMSRTSLSFRLENQKEALESRASVIVLDGRDDRI